LFGEEQKSAALENFVGFGSARQHRLHFAKPQAINGSPPKQKELFGYALAQGADQADAIVSSEQSRAGRARGVRSHFHLSVSARAKTGESGLNFPARQIARSL
jgi:hypothetical protein